MVNRRHFLRAGAVGIAMPPAAWAQRRPVKIGMLGGRPVAESFYSSQILKHLAELGYGKSAGLVVEARSADGYHDRFPGLARELVSLQCDVIIASGPEPSTRTFKDLKTSIPVVFLAIYYDPLEARIIEKLARPGGNMTGVYIPQNALVAKRLEMMREAMPAARRFLTFSDRFTREQLAALRKAADGSGVQVISKEFDRPPYDFAAAFEAVAKTEPQAYIGLNSPALAASEPRIAALLMKHRLPAIGADMNMKQPGFLLGFSTDIDKVTRRVAEITVRILKGAKPGDIPVEQADEFQLAVDARTAR